MAVDQDKILDIIRREGPILPAKLAKAIGTNILIASAHLSYFTDNNKVKISNTKVGGSPVYYMEEQKAKLQDFISNLNGKDQKVVEILKSKKVLRDDKQDQLTRLSLRTVKDFAIPLQVTKDNEKLLFWKWYLLSNEEAEGLIKGMMNIQPEVKKTEPQRTEQENTEKPVQKPVEQIKPADTTQIEKERQQLEEERKKLQKEREEMDKKIEAEKDIEKKQNEEIEKERKRMEEERKKLQKEREDMKKEMEKERQQLLQELESKKDTKEKPKEKKEEDPFMLQLNDYFKEKEIVIVESKIVKKKTEIDMLLKIPSVIGDIDYFCKARSKKSISDSDLSAAVVQGQLKKLPVLFLTTGELSKKAKELLNTDLNKGLLIKKI